MPRLLGGRDASSAGHCRASPTLLSQTQLVVKTEASSPRPPDRRSNRCRQTRRAKHSGIPRHPPRLRKGPAAVATSGCAALSPATTAAIDTASGGSRRTSPRVVVASPASVPRAGSVSAGQAHRKTPCAQEKATMVVSLDAGIPPLHSKNSHASPALRRVPQDLHGVCADSGRCAAPRRSCIQIFESLPPDPHRSATTARRNSHLASHPGTRGCLPSFSSTKGDAPSPVVSTSEGVLVLTRPAGADDDSSCRLGHGNRWPPIPTIAKRDQQKPVTQHFSRSGSGRHTAGSLHALLRTSRRGPRHAERGA